VQHYNKHWQFVQ